MKRWIGSLILLPALLIPCLPAEAGPVKFELHQRQDVMAQQQRIVGNLRAVARREGVVINPPQLYVYHGDYSEAYHLPGFRAGFERELDLIVDRRRGARSMVRLDRLLERVKTPEGEPVRVADLPEADVYLVLYRRADCRECDQVAERLHQWLADRPEREVVWLNVHIDRPRD